MVWRANTRDFSHGIQPALRRDSFCALQHVDKPPVLFDGRAPASREIPSPISNGTEILTLVALPGFDTAFPLIEELSSGKNAGGVCQR